MPTYIPAKKNTQFICYIGLVQQADTRLLKSSPTLATGDFKSSLDGAAFANLGTLPTVTPGSSTSVKVILSTSETNGDNVLLTCIDAAGAEWCDQSINIQTAARQVEDLAFPATSGRSMVVDAAGLVDANMVKVGPTGAGTAQTAKDIGSIILSAGAVTVGTNNDKTGYALSSAAIQAIYDFATSLLTTVGSIGKLFVTQLDTNIASRLPTSSYVAPLDAAGTRTAVGLASANLDTQFTNILDSANGLGTGWTIRQGLRVMAASAAGNRSGFSTNSPVIASIDGTKTRISSTNADIDGNATVTADGT